jgi:hypothetical protein
MATVPGPDPNKPLPIPGAPAQEPPRGGARAIRAGPAADRARARLDPEKWSPEREEEEVGAPTPL